MLHTILRLLDGSDPGFNGHELLALAGIHLLEKKGVWLVRDVGNYNVSSALIESRPLVVCFEVKRIRLARRDSRGQCQ